MRKRTQKLASEATRRDASAGATRGRRTVASPFVFEALEPRLLLSADLNYAAGQAFLGGLSALDSTVNQLASSTALTTPSAPFLNRSLSDVAGLASFAGLGSSNAAGDPIAAIKTVATTYFAANTSSTSPTKTGTVAGLASALDALSKTSGPLSVSVQATEVTTGSDDLLNLKIVSTDTQTNIPTAISESAGGNTLSTTQKLNEKTTQTLNLLFGVDVATASSPVFEVQSFGVTGAATFTGTGANNGGLTGNATVNSASETIVGGAAAIVVNVDDQLGATPAAPITWTSSTNGFATAATGITPTLTGISTLNLVTVSSGTSDAASQLKLDDDLSKPDSLTFTVTPVPPSALEDDVLNVFNDLNSEIANIQSSISSSTSFAFDLPLIGSQLAKILNPDTLLQPLTNEISALETQIKIDFADSDLALTRVQDDIITALSSADLLPDTNPADDVVFKYTDTNDQGTQTLTAGTAVDLSSITQLEVDLTLGQNVTGSVPLGEDLGIPGLGLKITQGSALETSVGWTLQVGLGMISQSGPPNPANAYLVLGGSGGPASIANNPTNAAFNFNVDLYLNNGFQAVGKIGPLEAVLTEPNEPSPGQHTGLQGNVGVAISGGSGTALNGGVEAGPSDLSGLTITPTFALTMQSELGLLFGADFVMQNGQYVDQSEFPSISVQQLEFNWTLDGSSLSSGSLPTPQVALMGISVDIGTALTDLIAPILKPFYDATNGLVPLFDFLTGPMPIISQLLTIVGGALPASVIQTVLPSYEPGQTYDWLNFAVDMMADDGDIAPSTAAVIAAIGNAAMKIIVQMDTAYSDIESLAGQDLAIPLGNFTFAGKNLALPQLNVTNASQFSAAGDQVAVIDDNIASAFEGSSDDAFTNAIAGLSGGGPVGSALSTLSGAGGTFSTIASDLDDALNAVSDGVSTAEADGSSAPSVNTNSVATVAFPFFTNPSSILGLIFGQNVQFINVDLGFAASVAETIPLFAVSFYGIVTASIDLNFKLGFDVGLQFGYDSQGLLDIAQGGPASDLLDGIYIAGDPLLKDTKYYADVVKLDAQIGASLNASLLLGLVSVGLEGGIDVTANVYVADQTSADDTVHYDQFSQQTVFDVSQGMLGPLDVSASGDVFLALIYSSFWGFGPSGSITLATFNFFTWPSPPPNPQNVDPLGFYDPTTQEFDLYVGNTAKNREDPSGNPVTPLYANPTTPQQVIANDSSTYVIDVQSDDHITVFWWNPVDNVWESQTPDGPVSEIVGETGSGNNTIIVNNLGPNNVQTDFTGSGGVQYNANQAGVTGGTVTTSSGSYQATTPTVGTIIGGDDVFEAAGGSSTLQGGPTGNDVLVGSRDPAPGTTPDDFITAGSGNATIVAGAGADTIQTGAGNALVYVGSGKELIQNEKPPAPSSGTLTQGQIPPAGSGGTGDSNPPGDDTLVAGGPTSFDEPFGPPGETLVDGSSVAETLMYGPPGQQQTSMIGGGLAVDIPGDTSAGDVTLIDYAGAGVGEATFSMVDGLNTLSYAGLQSSVDLNLATDGATGPGIGTESITGFSIVDGGPVASTLDGGTAAMGPETINGGSGGDNISGDGGDDHIYGANAGGTAYTGNTIYGGATANDTIRGGDGDNFIGSGDGKNLIYTDNGDDTVTLGNGANTVHGGVGFDSITAGNGNNLIDGGDGNDIILVGFGNNVINAALGNYQITAGNGANSITGERGDDVMHIGSGQNTIFGGTGNDFIVVGTGANTIIGGVGNDTMIVGIGGTGANTIQGSKGDDSIAVGDGANSVTGGTGDNVIMSGLGDESIDGGTGQEKIYAGVIWSQTSVGAAEALGLPLALPIGGTGRNLINGGTGNSLIVAGDGANDIIGGLGADSIYAGVGANSIYGGTGNDVIVAGVEWSKASVVAGSAHSDGTLAIPEIGGTGANTVEGGLGDDLIVVGDGANSVDGGTGEGTPYANAIYAGVGANSITGGHGDDSIFAGVLWSQTTVAPTAISNTHIGGTGANLINGGTGNDLIVAGDGNNSIDGGIGDDRIFAGVGTNTIEGGFGADQIYAGVIWTQASVGTYDVANVEMGGVGANTILGGVGSDLIEAGNGGNTIVGGTGDDTIFAGVGANSIIGGTGDDSIEAGVLWAYGPASVGGTGANTIYGGTGNTFIEAGDGANIIDGGIGDDIIISGFGDSTILGGTGNDRITVLGGDNVIKTGTGDSTVIGGTGSDLIESGDGATSVQGGGGTDTISLGDGDNTVQGGAGADNITVGDGNNLIVGGTGADVIVAGSGNNVIFGGAGNNYIADGAGHATIQGGGGNDTIYGGALASTILGGLGDDVIVGGAGGNLIVGGAGDNTIYGGAGGDTVYGGGGDNLLISEGGPSQIHGDHASLAFALSAIGVLAEAAVTPPTGATNHRATIYGGSGADSLYGGEGSDSIYGGPGTRLIEGGDQPTYIMGGAGSGVTIEGGPAGDVIIGSDGGHDSIVGGAGNNNIELRGGDDYASNGAGYGVIVGSTGNDTLQAGTGGLNTLIGGSASDQLIANSSEDTLDPDSGATAGYSTTGDALSSATVVPPAPTLPLPSDTVAQGWWSLVAGPAGMTLGGDPSNAATPAIVADATGPWVAWTQTSGGVQGLYVAHDVNGVWQAAGGSATGSGLALAGASASNPSIALVGGEPVVAFTSTSAAGRAVVVEAWNGSAWVGLGGSSGSAGISGVGAFDNSAIVETAAGPVVTWRNLAGAAPTLEALTFNGTAWVALGPSATVAGSSSVTSNYALATDGTNIAVAFSTPTAFGAELTILQSSGGAFAALPSPISTPSVAGDNSFATAPTLAYSGGSLFVAWVQEDPTTLYLPRLYAAEYSAGAWTAAGAGAASGYGLAPQFTVNDQPTLAANDGKLTLVWAATELTSAGQTQNLMSLTWNGAAFAAVLPTDIPGTGIGQLPTRANTLALTLDPNGRPWLAADTTYGTGLQIFAGEAPSAYIVAGPQNTVAAILAAGVTPGTLILVTQSTSEATFDLGPSDNGISIVGLDGVTLFGAAINGASNVTIRNLIFTDNVSVTNASDVTLAENTIGGLTLNGATGLLVRNNAIAGVSITGASGGVIRNNTIVDSAVGLDIAAAFTGLISDNAISGAQTGVVYAAAAPLANNRIYGSAVGVATAISNAATLFGAVAGSEPNTIEDNAVGVQLTNAQVINQTITRNVIGVSGSGLIGGTVIADYNLISYNQTGVTNFTGVIEYNRIEDNGVGIVATSELQIFSNQILANTQYGVLVSGVNNVQIAGNAIHSYIGDAIHLTASAYNIEIVSNILWADTGYDIYVDDNSQTGFWSDYNTLYATGAGKLVYWTMPFTDILDWQDDVDLYDLHSVGVTVVNPAWAEPHFGVDAYGFEITRPLVGGQRPTDQTQDGGDPAASFIGFNGVANLLVNGNFESALSGWTYTVGGSTTSTALTPFESTSEFESGTAANPTLQQTVNLSADATAIDAGSLQIAFGGMISLLSGGATAQISVQFYNASDVQIGDSVIATAASVSLWTRAFQTAYAPVGARSVQFLFSVTNSGGSQGALIDDAFLGVIAQGVGQDQGVRDAPDNVPGDGANGRILLTSPNLYQNWVASTQEFITWDSYGAAVGKPVDILLLQQTASGLKPIATIAAGAPDTGEFSWSPSNSDIAPGTTGLKIEIVSAANPNISSITTESFTVPVVGSEFYVATPANGGSNRNTGVSATSPLPNPVNLFRDYEIGAGDTVNIAAGTYPLIVPLDLSGSANLGFGLEQGFSIEGAAGGGVVLTPANPDITPAALIALVGANNVSINNLTLQGDVSALVVEDGSNNFSASNIVATGDSGVAFNITTDSPSDSLDHLTADEAGGAGLQFAGTIGEIVDFTAIGDLDGILTSDATTNTIAKMIGSTLENSTDYGLDLYLTGASLIESSVIEGNATGAFLDGSGIVFGDADVADGKGNIVSGNTYQAIAADGGVEVAGNTISDNAGRIPSVQFYNGGTLVNNLVFGNTYGVSLYSGSNLQITGNAIYDNGVYGLSLSLSGATISGNTLTNNGVGLVATGSTGLSITNNVFAQDAYAGLQLEFSTGTTIENNTFYELTAGALADPADPNYGVGAIVVDNSSTGTQILNNIVAVGAGAAIPVANSAQTGFVSNYNLFQIGAGAKVGTWLGLSQTTLAQWNAATGQDGASLSGNADFVAPTAATPDFHLMSPYGSDHGASLSVALGVNGLPVAATGTYVDDTATSPGVDGGDPASPLGAEPAAAGDIIEIGAYGGTNEASQSAPAFLTVTSPLGGADLTQGAPIAIDWNVFNVAGNVNILLSSDGGKTFATTIASGVAASSAAGANTGTYSWTIPTTLAGTDFVIEVVSASNPAVSAETASPFSVGPPVQAYYVNASSTAGGQYSSEAGNDGNSGESANAPVADLGALFAKGYTFSPGAIIYIDAGTYDLTQNIVLTAAYSGVTFQGSTTGATTFNRQNASGSGFYDFEVDGASGVTFDNLTLTGAQIGLSLDSGSGSTGVTVSDAVFSGDASDVFVGTGDSGFSILHSTIGAPTGSYGVDISSASNADVSDDVISLNNGSSGFAYAVEINSASGDVVSNNTLTGNGTYAPTLIETDNATNVTIDNNQLSGSSYFAIDAYQTGGVIEGNKVNATGGTFGIEGAGTSAQTLVIQSTPSRVKSRATNPGPRLTSAAMRRPSATPSTTAMSGFTSRAASPKAT
jgi:Ca2+-binding RTX toxin-like protein